MEKSEANKERNLKEDTLHCTTESNNRPPINPAIWQSLNKVQTHNTEAIERGTNRV